MFPFLAGPYVVRSTRGLALSLSTCLAIAVALWFATGGAIGGGPLVLARCLPLFMAGMILHCLYTRRAAPWVGRDATFYAILVFFAAAGILGLPDGIIIAAMPLLVFSVAQNDGHVAQLLNTAIPSYLGRISYSLYMVQFVALVGAVLLVPSDGLLRTAIFPAISLAMAAVISPLVEYPARDWIKRRLALAAILGVYRLPKPAERDRGD